MKIWLLVSSDSPNVVDNSSGSLSVALLGTNVLSDFWSALVSSPGLTRWVAIGFLHQNKMLNLSLNLCIYLPTLYHQLVHGSRTTRWWWESVSIGDLHQILKEYKTLKHVHNLLWCACLFPIILLKWFVTQTPYLIHYTSKTPHITLCWVLLVEYCLQHCSAYQQYNNGP